MGRQQVAGLLIVLALAILACTNATEDRGIPSPARDIGTPVVRPSIEPAPPACSAPYRAGPLTTDTVFCADPALLESARVVRVVDGDTIRVEVDGREEAVRFFGIDTAERGERCFAEATALVTALAGTTVLLRPDARDRDRNGRLLRYVYTTDGLSIDAVMVATGYALAWTRDGDLREPLIALEDAARDARRGCLWR